MVNLNDTFYTFKLYTLLTAIITSLLCLFVEESRSQVMQPAETNNHLDVAKHAMPKAPRYTGLRLKLNKNCSIVIHYECKILCTCTLKVLLW